MGAEKNDMPPELRRLLEVEAQRGDPSEGLKAQVRARLTADPRLQGPPTAKTGRGRLARVLSSPWMIAGVLATVAGLGWWASRLRPARLEAVSPLLAPPSPAAAAEPQAAPRAVEVPKSPPAPAAITPAVTSRKRHPDPVHGEPSIETSLARERQLIGKARADLRAGRHGEALNALHEHEREFPNGVLVEERLGLQIEVLAARGEVGEAQRRAVEFRRRFPGSPLQSAIDSALPRSPP